MIWIYIVVFIISCLILIRSGTLVVKTLIRMAQFLEWREFTVSFILMAFATTIPELFVGLISAFSLKPELSFGNIIGSNIINLTLVIALGVLLANGLKTGTAMIQRTSIYTAVIASLPIILMLDGVISRIDGLVLLLSLVFYFHLISLQEKKFTRIFSNKFKREWPQFKLFLKDLGVFLIGIFLLLLAAEGIVWTASFFAKIFNLPLVLIGTLIVALGTNLPEITFGIRAITLRKEEMLLGNLMGAVVVNSTLVLGLTFLISPLEIPEFSLYTTGIIFTIFTALFFAIFSRTGKEITKKEGLFLLGIYILFVMIELLTK